MFRARVHVAAEWPFITKRFSQKVPFQRPHRMRDPSRSHATRPAYLPRVQPAVKARRAPSRHSSSARFDGRRTAPMK